jgi:uncharacterized protein YlxP (DUF503 family)
VHLAALVIELHIPGCASLKQKRSRLKPLLINLNRKFNVSAAELDQLDQHNFTTIVCAAVSNETAQVQRVLNRIPNWIETNRPDLQIIDHELIQY